MMNNKYIEMKNEAVEKLIETLDYFSDYYCDLHNEAFNTDYYIIGTYEARKALNEFDVFEAIEKVQEYEKFNFGEVYTDISNPEKLVNMLFYIIGEEVVSDMYQLKEFNNNWDKVADEETNKIIINFLKKLKY